jgi:hypothetical protein
MHSPRNCFNNEVIREPALARRIARKLANGRQVLGRLTLGGSGRCTRVETTAAIPARRWPLELDPGTSNARSQAPRALRRDGENRLAHAACTPRPIELAWPCSRPTSMLFGRHQPPWSAATKMTGPTVRSRSFSRRQLGRLGQILSIRRAARAGSLGGVRAMGDGCVPARAAGSSVSG